MHASFEIPVSAQSQLNFILGKALSPVLPIIVPCKQLSSVIAGGNGSMKSIETNFKWNFSCTTCVVPGTMLGPIKPVVAICSIGPVIFPIQICNGSMKSIETNFKWNFSCTTCVVPGTMLGPIKPVVAICSIGPVIFPIPATEGSFIPLGLCVVLLILNVA